MINTSFTNAYVGVTTIKEVRHGGRLVLAPNGNKLWYDSNELPSLDLRFAEDKSLVDATTGSNLVDFTRASSGTYVGSDGVIRTAVTNLLLRSEEFDQSPWVATAFSGGTAPTVTANAATAPDGTVTADQVSFSAETGSQQGSLQQNISVTSGVQYTLSFWARTVSGTVSNLLLRIGTTEEVIGQPITTEWKRYSTTVTVTSSGTVAFKNRPSATGDGTAIDIYLWGAQLEQSDTVGEYVKTTSTINSAPRFDHDPTTGESLGLLVEESRTNLALDSENLSTANWDVNGSATITSGFTSPRGDNSAYLVQNATTLGDSNSGNDNLRKNNNTDASFDNLSVGTYTVSGYVKANGATTTFYPRTRLINSGVNSDGGINISTNWQRFTRTVTATVTDDLRLIFSADSIDGFYLWGLQVEVGFFPTSYIPTEGSTVTRAADVASISGSNFSSWYRQDEGTMFVSSDRQQQIPATDFAQLFFISDGSSNNAINLGWLTSSFGQFRVRAAGTNEANLFDSSTALSRKIAGAYAVNSATSSINGGSPSSDASVTLPTGINMASLGSDQAGTTRHNGTIRRLTYWPQRLPNSTLQTITQ